MHLVETDSEGKISRLRWRLDLRQRYRCWYSLQRLEVAGEMTARVKNGRSVQRNVKLNRLESHSLQADTETAMDRQVVAGPFVVSRV
jgi:hypothetical protein